MKKRELGERLLECKAWRYGVGVVLCGGGVVYDVDGPTGFFSYIGLDECEEDKDCEAYKVGVTYEVNPKTVEPWALPDITNPCTKGWVTQLLRELSGRDDITTFKYESLCGCSSDSGEMLSEAIETEEEALIVGLESLS